MTSKAYEFLQKSAQSKQSPTFVLERYEAKGFVEKDFNATAKDASGTMPVFGQVQAAATLMHWLNDAGYLDRLEAAIEAESDGDADKAAATFEGAIRDLCAALVIGTNASGWAAKLGKKDKTAAVVGDY
jgi:hypothetical protein